MFTLRNEEIVANLPAPFTLPAVNSEGAPTSKSVPIPFSALRALCVSAFSSPNVDALDAASTLSPLPATHTKNTGGGGTSQASAKNSNRSPSVLNCVFPNLSSFIFKLLALSVLEGSTFSCCLPSPFPATLLPRVRAKGTDSSQPIENPATLSPAFATLTSCVNPNPFVCHSYRKHRGWRTLSSPSLLPRLFPALVRLVSLPPYFITSLLQPASPPLKPLPPAAHLYTCTCKKGPAAREPRYSPCAAS